MVIVPSRDEGSEVQPARPLLGLLGYPASLLTPVIFSGRVTCSRSSHRAPLSHWLPPGSLRAPRSPHALQDACHLTGSLPQLDRELLDVRGHQDTRRSFSSAEEKYSWYSGTTI